MNQNPGHQPQMASPSQYSTPTHLFYFGHVDIFLTHIHHTLPAPPLQPPPVWWHSRDQPVVQRAKPQAIWIYPPPGCQWQIKVYSIIWGFPIKKNVQESWWWLLLSGGIDLCSQFILMFLETPKVLSLKNHKNLPAGPSTPVLRVSFLGTPHDWHRASLSMARSILH